MASDKRLDMIAKGEGWLSKAARRMPRLREVIRQRDALLSEIERLAPDRARLFKQTGQLGDAPGSPPPEPQWVPPGHFYSPLPSLDEVRRDGARIFRETSDLPGVDMREPEQVALLEKLAVFYPEIPFREKKCDGLRYFYDNGAYSYSDAIFLHCMIRHLKPARIIEIGSGHSSCVTLDTNERFFSGSIRCTFIEPYPETLLALLKPGEREQIDLIPTRLQDVDPQLFDQLGENDILFVDSTHVSKTGSDVNFNFFDILPRLKPGVYVHIHDIFYPFEYPEYWVYEGRAWNEAYLLHAFLQFNDTYQVVAHTDFLARVQAEKLFSLMPNCKKNTGGSIWLRRVK